MNFRGGKGAATCIGFSFMIDYKLGIAVVVSIVLFALMSNYIAIGTISVDCVMLGYVFLFDCNPVSVSIILIVFIISIAKHIENFVRIKNGTEVGIIDRIKWGKS